MKKIMLFAAACAALAACSKNIDTTSTITGDATAFEKGQKVTLTVNTGDQTKVTSSLDGSTGAVDFKWETGDKIKVTVGTESAEFILSSGAGTATAEFTGTMPASGETFNVQYPVTEPDLATQTYSATEAIPHDMMKFTATGCTLGNSFTLTPQNAALRLNLYGIERKVSQIVVTDMTSTASTKPSYTLSISPAITVSGDKNTPTPFFIVVPAGTSAWDFKTEMTSEAVTPSTYVLPKYPSNTEPNYGSGILVASGSFTTTSAKTFTAGEILNMAAVSLTTVWAPVNCGYDATNYPMGLLYQWGRQYGQAYEKETISPSSLIKSDDTAGNKDKFGEYNTTNYNWFIGDVDNTLWNGGTKGTKDPCPEGWRVPTSTELQALITTKVWTTTGGPSGNQKGYLFGTSPNQVFLPAAGFRSYGNGSAYLRGYYGYYWSSSVNDGSARNMYFGSGYASLSLNYRATGYSVRCVQE